MKAKSKLANNVKSTTRKNLTASQRKTSSASPDGTTSPSLLVAIKEDPHIGPTSTQLPSDHTIASNDNNNPNQCNGNNNGKL